VRGEAAFDPSSICGLVTQRTPKNMIDIRMPEERSEAIYGRDTPCRAEAVKRSHGGLEKKKCYSALVSVTHRYHVLGRRFGHPYTPLQAVPPSQVLQSLTILLFRAVRSPCQRRPKRNKSRKQKAEIWKSEKRLLSIGVYSWATCASSREVCPPPKQAVSPLAPLIALGFVRFLPLGTTLGAVSRR